MNFLILSAGIRGYLIRYFKEAVGREGIIIAADCDSMAPALYDAHEKIIIPQLTDTYYFDTVVRICQEKKISGLISLNDLELSHISKNRNKFERVNTTLILSKPETIEICYDKYKTYCFLKNNGFNSPKTYISLEEVRSVIESKQLSFPLILKPRYGSASIGIKIIEDLNDLLNETSKTDNYIIQEFLSGDEYGADIFNNNHLKPVSVYIKKKLRMRAGETDKAVSVYNVKIIEIIKRLSGELGFFGPADIDFIENDNEIFILEINPRFGGGYPLSHALGANFPDKIINIVNNIDIKDGFHPYPNDVVMLKQPEIIILKNQ